MRADRRADSHRPLFRSILRKHSLAHRRDTRRRMLATILTLSLITTLVAPAWATGGSDARPSPLPYLDGADLRIAEKKSDTLLDPILSSLVEAVEEKSETAARALARVAELDYAQGRVTVVVESMPGRGASARVALAEAGGAETGSYKDLIRAEVPVQALEGLSRHPAVFKVRAPMRPVLHEPTAAEKEAFVPRVSGESLQLHPDSADGRPTISDRGSSNARIVQTEIPGELATSLDAAASQRREEALVAPDGIDLSSPGASGASSELFAHGFETWFGPWYTWSPSGTPTWGQTSYRKSEGSYSAYCAGSSISPPGPYANNMQSWLWTGPFDLSTHSEARVTFDLWLDSESGYDGLLVGLSVDDETYEWTVYSGYSAGWLDMEIDLADLYGDGTVAFTGEPEVWLAFLFVSDGSVTYEGAYIDDVRISAGTAPPPDIVTSEGVEETNATAMHAEGIDGTGVKVGIIDGGFQGYEALLGRELPDSVYTWGGSSLGPEGSAGEVHGTAVAETVHDMAPGSDLYLAQFDDEIDFGNAAAWMRAQGVDVVNYSCGFFLQPGDGTGIINEIVDQTVQHDIFWANSAGNEREIHWSGDWVELSGGLQWAPDANLQVFDASAGHPIVGFLTWDDSWEAATQDYDLLLYGFTGSGWALVAESANPQTGVLGHQPTEVIGLYAPATATYAWVVARYSATRTDVDFDFYNLWRPLQHQVTSRSVGSQAPVDNTSDGFMAAGAIGRAPSFEQESYSSEGPTNDGRLAPHMAAPASTANYTYGTFSGTSASSPHLAGAAALVLDAGFATTAPGVRTYFESTAIDLGPPGPDNAYGHGRIWLEPDGEPGPSTIDLQHDAAGVVFDRWVTGYSTAYSGDGYVYGRWTGTELTARFTGSTIRWVGPKQPSYGMADVYIDGVRVAENVDCYAPAGSATLDAVIWESGTLTDGPHTISIRLKGNRNASSSGNVVVLDRFEVDGAAPKGGGVRIDDAAAAPGYTGNWISAINPTYYDKTYSYSRWPGHVFSVTFNGTKVAWLGPMTPFYGKAEIWLDGSYVTTVDAYRSYQGWRERIWESGTLSSGTHTLEIRPTGEKNPASTSANVVVDAIDVTE